MQIAQVLGGYTLGGADLLRRAMGKKKPEEMAQQRDIFVDGAAKNGLSRARRPTQIFDLMEKFAGYGFNKSHAAAYALLAYQTAYLKAHHPAAFMAANLSLVMDDTDKVQPVLRRRGRATASTILPPGRQRIATTASCRSTRKQHPLRPRRASRAPARRRSRRSSPRATRRPVQRPVRLLPPRRQAHRQPARRRGAGARRRVRLDRRAPRARCSPRSGIALEAAEQAERTASQVSLFGEAEAPRGGAAATSTRAPWDMRAEADRGEGGARLLPVRASVQRSTSASWRGFARTPLAKLAAGRARHRWPAS